MRKRIFLVVPLVALMCWAAPAAAAPVDTHSAHLALRAYRAYLSSEVSRLHAVKRNDDALIKTVGKNCPGVLDPVSLSDDANEGAAVQFGKEVGADLVLTSFAALQTPLATLAQRVERLQWSHPATGRRIAAALEGESKAFAFAPSDLCADATAFAASGGKSVSPATKAFLTSFDQVTSGGDISPFTDALRRFRPANDRKLLKQVALIETHADDRLLEVVIARVPDLLDAVGLNI